MITKFIQIISDVKGNISPQKFNQKYFYKYNHHQLWDWFTSQSQNFPNYPPRDVVILMQHGYTEAPKCIVCGNNAKVQSHCRKENSTFNYCSRYCSLTSKERCDKISKTRRTFTQERIDEINAKREETNLNKTGFKFNSQRPEVKQILKEKLSKSQLSSLAHEKLHDKEWLNHNYNVLKRTSVDIADEIQADYTTVLDYCRNYGFEIRKFTNESLPQKQLFEFVKEIYAGDVLYNDWNFLKTLELDVVVPELNLAIEFNGLYYHSSVTTNDRNKHLNKTLLCEEKGINLIHVRSDQWQFQKEIIKSMLKSKLGLLKNKLYARKCQIVKLESKLAKSFLKENHIQGSVDSSISYGLMFKNELVSVMTFNKPRFNKNYDWELMRFCNKLDHTIIGAFSKLLKHFRNNHEGSIISYCDRSRSNGNVYYKNGFELIEKKLEPGYFWTDRTKVYNRQHFQKHKLKKLFANNEIKYYNENESEFDNMIKNGYRIYYDCGNLAFILK